MSMRMGAAVLAAAACVALGAWAARRLARREDLLNAWDSALIRMEGAITHSGAGLRDVLKIGAGQQIPLLSELARRMEESPAAAPGELIAALPWDPLLTPPEKETLLQCLEGLFSPSLTQQAQAVAYAREQWSVFRRISREVREKNGRLYWHLGWLSGAALFILLC